MEKIDMETWVRREAFRHFSRAGKPFWSVTFPVDVTCAADYAKARGLSFYCVMVYLCTKAVAQVDAMMLDVRDGEVWRLDRRRPSFADLQPGEEQFRIITVDCDGSLEEFCRAAAEKRQTQTVFLDESQEGSDMIFFSCLPWIPFTALTNEGCTDPDDLVPRITFGRWTETDGRRMMPLSVEVNHRTVDGVHIGLFARALERETEALGGAKD